MNRRGFLRATAVMAAGTGFVGPVIRGAERTRKYRVALLGSGWWGKNILTEAIASGECKVAALADVDASALEITSDRVQELSGDKPKTYGDYRELLEKEKPDIVIVAAPDHWHALMTIDALKAGAHVYLEKPTGHTVNESIAILRTARATGKTVQVGLHRRVAPHHLEAIEFLRSNAIGKVGMVRLFAHSGGGIEQPSMNEEPPADLDWNFWCGPAPLRPFNKRIHPGGWRQYLDFANGILGDWGVHWLDQVLWWSEETHPRQVYCTGGRAVRGPAVLNEKEQTTDAPDHQVATFAFEQFTCVWEHRQFAGNATEKHNIGAYFYGEKGVLHLGWRDGWTFYPSAKSGKVVHQDARLQEPDGHSISLLWSDFLAALNSERPPTANIEVAHRASLLPLLGMISWRVQRSIAWDAGSEQIPHDAEANRLLSRPYRAPWKYPAA